MHALIALVIATTPAPAAEPPSDSPTFSDEEKAELKKLGLPLAPSTSSVKYAAWKKKLSKTNQKRLDRYCRKHGGEALDECNGIGPYAIPRPPSLAPSMGDKDSFGNNQSAHSRWQAALTVQQNRYYQDYCSVHDEGEHDYSELCGGTPLVLSFDDARVEYTGASPADATDWPTSATPWLVLDRDGDGAISSATEFFGNATPLASGARAKNGFESLRELDANGDGVLDARDPMFAKLAVWTDANDDRQSTAAELAPLSSRVESISLSFTRQSVCDARHNCEGERSAMTWRDARGVTHTGSVIDVYLAWR